jgi:cytochrome c
MSGLELNKIAAAILLSALVAMIVGVVANILYKPKLEVTTRGYSVQVHAGADNGEGSGAKETPPDIPALMASANAEEGAKVVKKCLACHSFEQGGANKVGPNLWKVHGGPKAHRSDFPYSKALASAGGIWDDESMFNFLHKPGKFLPGTKMTFVGLSNPQDIANVIAYFKANVGG